MKDSDIKAGIDAGYFNIELLNKIIQFELEHPDVIKKWREDDEKKYREWHNWKRRKREINKTIQ